MKEINFIAFLGLYLVISPQAAGQESGSLLAKMVIERQVSKSDLVQKVCKKYPFPKRKQGQFAAWEMGIFYKLFVLNRT